MISITGINRYGLNIAEVAALKAVATYAIATNLGRISHFCSLKQATARAEEKTWKSNAFEIAKVATGLLGYVAAFCGSMAVGNGVTRLVGNVGYTVFTPQALPLVAVTTGAVCSVLFAQKMFQQMDKSIRGLA
jgi:hypothetical protein